MGFILSVNLLMLPNVTYITWHEWQYCLYSSAIYLVLFNIMPLSLILVDIYFFQFILTSVPMLLSPVNGYSSGLCEFYYHRQSCNEHSGGIGPWAFAQDCHSGIYLGKEGACFSGQIKGRCRVEVGTQSTGRPLCLTSWAIHFRQSLRIFFWRITLPHQVQPWWDYLIKMAFLSPQARVGK